MESKQFCTKKTKEEMDAESKAATAKEMESLLSLLAAVPKQSQPVDCDETASYSSDSSEDSRLRRRRRAPKSNLATEKLESRIHYMKLDLANQMVDLQKAREELEDAKRKLEVFATIHKNFASLKELVQCCYTCNEDISVEQLDKKHSLIKMEMSSRIEDTKKLILSIDYSEVKFALQNSLYDETKTMEKALDDLHWTATKKEMIQGALKASFIALLLIVVGFVVFIAFS